MKTIKVAVNGAGRIGRAFVKLAQERKEIEVVAVNDLGSLESIVYLFKYDTVYGPTPFPVEAGKDGKSILINGKSVAFVQEKDPTKLPWGSMGVDIVVESTGLFTAYDKARAHLQAGAKRVVVTAPVKDEPPADIKGATVLMGINDDLLTDVQISSNASCTTNAGSPVMAILHDAIGIEKAMLNTVHGYTASQALVDGPSKKDLREGRAAAQNIVPSSTGAAIAVTQALPDLKGKFDGISIRVPVPVGSIADITFISKRNTSVEEVNDILTKASKDKRWMKVFTVTDEPLVSSDIIGSSQASIVDLAMTRVVDGNLVKVLAWYDNEMGYTHALMEHVVASGKAIR